MKTLFIAFTIPFIFLSCTTSQYKSREVINVLISKTKVDSTSIRAIEIYGDTAVVYAGSKGNIGIFDGTEIEIIAAKIVTDSVVPHFRSLAKTNNAIFALSVENPALLYKITAKTITIVYKEEGEKVFYDAMRFFDDLNGIAMGDPTNGCLSIITTQDGGNSWKKIPCENLPKIEEGEAAFAASNTNIAIVGSEAWIVTGGIKARVFYTSNMGFTWKVYNTPIVQGKNTTGIYSVDFYNEKQGIIGGGDYLDKYGDLVNIALTFDGGKTWKIVTDKNAPKYVSCIQYVPNTQGKEVFAVSTNGIFYSNNSGKNWQKVSDESFYSIRIATKNLAWLSGNEVIAKMNINALKK